jgi:hypothetical protein
MVTNADRAAWAQIAVEAFQAVCATDDEDAVKDLVVNLCHLERRNRAAQGESFSASDWLESRAIMHDMEVCEDEEE